MIMDQNCIDFITYIRQKFANMEWSKMIEGIDTMVDGLLVYLGRDGEMTLDLMGKYSYLKSEK